MTVTVALSAAEAAQVPAALVARAATLRRSAEAASVEVEEQRAAGADVRTQATKVVAVLGTAGMLEAVAARITAARTGATTAPGGTPGATVVFDGDEPPAEPDERTRETLAALSANARPPAVDDPIPPDVAAALGLDP